MTPGERLAADVRKEMEETRRALMSLVALFNRRCEREGTPGLKVPVKDRRAA